ncbi:MAG: hypothetical protein JXA81_11780 [Sedimentisphaerales bacterium]|nr:hypothetical protein [Sedimentisphaerales bacterium]
MTPSDCTIVHKVYIWHFLGVAVKEKKFQVRTYECGVDGRIKILSLMQHLQDIATGEK